MVNILLVCSAGMSTSALVKKMDEAAQAKGVEAKIWAVGDAQSKEDAAKAEKMVSLLMGDVVQPRKNYMYKYAEF